MVEVIIGGGGGGEELRDVRPRFDYFRLDGRSERDALRKGSLRSSWLYVRLLMTRGENDFSSFYGRLYVIFTKTYGIQFHNFYSKKKALCTT